MLVKNDSPDPCGWKPRCVPVPPILCGKNAAATAAWALKYAIRDAAMVIWWWSLPPNGDWPTLGYSDGVTAETAPFPLLLLWFEPAFELFVWLLLLFVLVERDDSLKPRSSWIANGDRCGNDCELSIGRLRAAGAVTCIVSGRGIDSKFISNVLPKKFGLFFILLICPLILQKWIFSQVQMLKRNIIYGYHADYTSRRQIPSSYFTHFFDLIAFFFIVGWNNCLLFYSLFSEYLNKIVKIQKMSSFIYIWEKFNYLTSVFISKEFILEIITILWKTQQKCDLELFTKNR